MKSWVRIVVVSLLLTPIFGPPARAAEIHYAPEENLERIDAALLSRATRTIDLASFILTDRKVVAALVDASRRGVKVRVVLDPGQKTDYAALGDLADGVRVKAPGPLMHLKSFCVDGALLRSGSANTTWSGEKEQDNDLVVLDDPRAASAFEAHFERMWSAATPMDAFGPAIAASEPR